VARWKNFASIAITVSSKVWRPQGRNCGIMYTTAKNRRENNRSTSFEVVGGKARRTKVEYIRNAILLTANITDQAEEGGDASINTALMRSNVKNIRRIVPRIAEM